jgi:lipopolysaccharide biosynthesis glycosyltransferase
MENSKIEIVVCMDMRYVMPTGVMMYSVCVNNPDVNIAFHVIHDDSVTDRDKCDLEESLACFNGKSLAFYDVDLTCFPCFPNLTYGVGGVGITQASYYRLMLSELLPLSIKKVLYLDGDIIVRGKLSPLWDTDMTNHAIAAVSDAIEDTAEFYNRLKYPRCKGYFNAGVMLVNLDYWRKHNVVSEFMDFIKNRADDILYHEQDVLNVIFQDNKVTLPIKYNLNSGFLWKSPRYDRKYEREVLEARREPVIVHFTEEKPWMKYQRNPHPFISTWRKYQNRTKWKGVRIDKRPFKLRVINYVADVLRKYRMKSQLVFLKEYIDDIAPIE